MISVDINDAHMKGSRFDAVMITYKQIKSEKVRVILSNLYIGLTKKDTKWCQEQVNTEAYFPNARCK